MSQRTIQLKFRGDALYSRLCELAPEMLAALAPPGKEVTKEPEQRSRSQVEIDRSQEPFTEQRSRVYTCDTLRAIVRYDASHWNADECARCAVSLAIEGHVDVKGDAQGGMIESLAITLAPAPGSRLDRLLARIPII